MEGVDSWVRAWARHNPGGVAVTFEGTSVTWAQLDRRVDVLADHLLSRGIARGARVGCLMQNCVEFLETLHAVSRIGAVFVPLNIRYAAPELAFAVQHAELSLVVADDSFAPLVTAGDVSVDLLWRSAWPEDGSTPPVPSCGRWSDDGFLLFTSGTTGTPRAVRHAQEGFLWSSFDAVLIHEFTARDRMLTALPLCYTGGLNVSMAMAHSGGELVLAPKFDAGELLALIPERAVTLFHGVPTMCQRMVEHPAWTTADLSSLRLARTGGAPVPAALMEAFWARGIPLTQGYGLTESAGTGFTLHAREARRFGKCGRPSFSIDARVVSAETGEDVAPGEVGELLLRGPQVMRGYWREPEATARTVRDGWLWTGDLGTLDDEGFFEIAGRSKDLIVTGGLNVYPAEVEHALVQAPGVLEAAVLGVPSQRWGEEVVAVVVTEREDADAGDLIAYCRTVLADYKCPKEIVISREPLPRTASGKVVKREAARWLGIFM